MIDSTKILLLLKEKGTVESHVIEMYIWELLWLAFYYVNICFISFLDFHIYFWDRLDGERDFHKKQVEERAKFSIYKKNYG